MNIVELSVPNPDQLLAAAGYGAGAVVRVQSSATQAGVYANVGTAAIVSGVFTYLVYDQPGASTTWYESRYENAGGTILSDWSAPFQVGQGGTAIGDYAALAGVKLRLGRTDVNDDPLIAKYCGWVNGRMEQIMGRAVAPYTVAGPYLFDGSAVRSYARMLPIKQGIQSVTQVRVKASTQSAFQIVPIGDIRIRPHVQDRPVGWPGTQLWMVDEPSATNPMGRFPILGLDTIEVTGVLGWAAIPDELTDVGETVAVRAFQARRTGQSDTVGADAQGQAIISRILAAEFKEVLARYAWVPI